MNDALSLIASYLPLPDTVALDLYETYPVLVADLLTNPHISVEAWSHLDLTSLPVWETSTILNRPDASDLVSRVCAGTDRRVRLVSVILGEWNLPEATQRQIITKRMPVGSLESVITSSLPDSLKLTAADRLNRSRRVLDWLVGNPAISDADYLRVAATFDLDETTKRVLLGQRPHLAEDVVQNRDLKYLAAAAAVIEPGPVLHDLVDWLIDRTDDHPEIVRSVRRLAARCDVGGRTIHALLSSLAPGHRYGIPDAFKQAQGPIAELDRASAVDLLTRMLEVRGYSLGWWQMFTLALRDDIPDTLVRSALRRLPHRVLISGIAADAYARRYTHLCGTYWAMQPVRINIQTRNETARRRTASSRLSRPRYYRSVSAPEPTLPVAGADTMTLGSLSMLQDNPSYQQALGDLLGRELGDGSEPASMTAWRAWVRLVEAAPNERTISQTLVAVRSLTQV